MNSRLGLVVLLTSLFVNCTSRTVVVSPTESADVDDAGSAPTSDGGGFGLLAGTFGLASSNASHGAPADFPSGLAPADGTRFLFLTATLTNTREATPLSLNPAFFTVVTASHLVISLELAGSVSGACTGSVAVAEGGTSSCNLVFEMPVTDSPVSLVYTDTQQRTAAAPIALPTNERSCVDPYVDTLLCSECLKSQCRTELGPWTVTDPDIPNSKSMCEAATTIQKCTSCACVDAEVPSRCASAYEALNQCALLSCASKCMPFN